MERSKRANRGQNYARWTREARLEDENVSKRRRTQDKEEGGVRCSCGATVYDEKDTRPMVECENCLQWQHIACATNGTDTTPVPEPYNCYLCRDKDQDYQEEAVEDVPVHKQDAPLDKVRQSVITALERIFMRQLMPIAQRENLLDDGLDSTAYSTELAKEIELALFKAHAEKGADVGQKYRERFRTLSFNLKDDKNHLLQTQIITRQVSPEALAALSADEMLSPELRKLADQVKQESIQGSILKVDEGPRVRKTHKGEELVENENQPPQRPEDVTPTPEPKVAADPATRKEPEHQTGEAQYGNFDTFNDLDFSPVSPADVNANDDDDDDPAANDDEEDDDDDFEKTMTSTGPTLIWHGSLNLEGVAKLEADAFHIGNHKWSAKDWPRAFDTNAEQIQIKGRLNSEVASTYMAKISVTRVIGTFALIDSGDSPSYNTLYNHFRARSKYGVLPNHTLIVKDAYLVPIAQQDEIPSWLGLGDSEAGILQELIERKGKLLLGIYVLPSEKMLYS